MKLTRREDQVLNLIMEEKTSKEIGDALSISPRTVEVYRQSMIKKTRAKNIVGLIKFALSHGKSFG